MLIGNKLKEFRKEKGIKQNELANKAGISNTYLSDIEVGRTYPSLRTLVRLTKALEIDMELLFKSI